MLAVRLHHSSTRLHHEHQMAAPRDESDGNKQHLQDSRGGPKVTRAHLFYHAHEWVTQHDFRLSETFSSSFKVI